MGTKTTRKNGDEAKSVATMASVLGSRPKENGFPPAGVVQVSAMVGDLNGASETRTRAMRFCQVGDKIWRERKWIRLLLKW